MVEILVPGHFTAQKLEISAGLMVHLAYMQTVPYRLKQVPF